MSTCKNTCTYKKMPSVKPDVKGLDISIEDIRLSRAEDIASSRSFYKVLEKTYFDQVEKEANFLASHKWVCPPPVDPSVLSHALSNNVPHSGFSRKNRSKRSYDQDSEDEEDLKSVFFDAKSLEHLACVADDIFLFEGPNFRTNHKFIKNIITDVRLIGKPSVNGFAMTANLYDKYHDMIVLKAPRTNSEYTEANVVHEVVVGKILNNLRSIIPNFSYVLGSFKCGPPIVRPPVEANSKSPGKVLDWCRGGPSVRYLMYEKVSDAISFYDYIKVCSAQDYLDILVQINYALLVAFEECGFTHYDVHGENILIKTVKDSEDGFYIPYQGDFVYGTKVATFIDYGYAHVYLSGNEKSSVGIKDSGGPRGNLSMTSHGIYQDHVNPAGDCLYILHMSLAYMKYPNPKVFDQVKELIYFFFPESDSLDKIFSENINQYPYFGTPAYLEKIKKFRYRNFLKYVREFCIVNDFNDPVVSGNDYDEALDGAILMPSVSPMPTHFLRETDPEDSLMKKKVETVEEVFDLVEPIAIYKHYLETNKTNFGESKIKGHSSLVDKVFAKIRNKETYIATLIDKEIKDLFSEIRKIKYVNYKKIPSNEVYIMRSSLALKEYLDSVEATVNYLAEVESIEKKVEMINYIKKNILTNSEIKDADLLESEFRKKDERSVIFKFISDDIYSLEEYLDSRSKKDKIDEKLDIVLESLISIYPG